MPVWPASLPPPLLQGYRLTPVDPVIRTQMEAGPAQARRRSTAALARASAVWRVTSAQAEALHEFWRADCQHGALPFAWYEPLRGRPGRWSFAAPPERTPISPLYEDVAVDLLRHEEWWPGDLAGPGRTVRIWDARWSQGLRADLAGAQIAAAGGPVGQWRDRVVEAALVAPSDAGRPALSDRSGAPVVATAGSPQRLDLAGLQIDRAAFGLAIACWLEDTLSAGYRRVVCAPPAAGNDYDRADALIVTSDDETDVGLFSRLGGPAADSLELRHDTAQRLGPIALVAGASASAGWLDVAGEQVATATGKSLSGLTAGGLRLGAGHIAGAPGNYGARAYAAVAIVSGYTPTAAERVMLGRWAAALAGLDP